MSHQDQGHSTPNAEDLQEALRSLVPDEALEGIEFQDDSRWKPISLVFGALMWSWSGKATLTERFKQALKILRFLTGDGPQPGKSYQGFLKRLKHWSEPLLERLKAEFRRRMRTDLVEHALVAGWLLMAADGSRSAMPRTKSNQQRFSPPKPGKKGRTRRREKQVRAWRNRRQKQSQADRAKKAENPQVWLTVLYVVTLGLPWDWRSGPSDSSERKHLCEMARGLPQDALVTMDAGFVGYEFWKTLLDAKVGFVSRVGGNVKLLKSLGLVRCQGNIVYVWTDAAQRKNTPPLALRLERFRGGKEDVYLVTNVWDQERLSTQALKAVYKARWGVELFYRDFKQTFERGKLRSKSADNVQLEVDWSFMGLWAMNLLASLEHAAAGVTPSQRSVANVLRAFRTPMHEYKSAPEPGEDLWSLLSHALKDEYQRTSSKASRDYPHKKQKHAISSPDIVPATAKQIDAAREFFKTDSYIKGLPA
jgi:hypothetical protein